MRHMKEGREVLGLLKVSTIEVKGGREESEDKKEEKKRKRREQSAGMGNEDNQ